MDSLRIATEHYYWKPGKAFSRSLELEEYARAGICFEHPLLDLGCSDGTFAEMLRERGILDSVDVALDYSGRDLWRVKESAKYGVIQGDATDLPLKSDILASVIANLVISAIRTDVDRSISEIYRVLANGGLFVLTVPTYQIDETQLIPNVLKKMGAPRLATRYLKNLNRRLDDLQRFDEQEWIKRLKERHFRIEQVRHYFTPHQAFWSNLLTLQIFRIFAPLKIMKAGWVKRQAARIEEKIFRFVLMKEQPLVQSPDKAGGLLIVARK